MDKKSFCPRFTGILTLFVLCFLVNAPIQAQQPNNSEDSFEALYQNFKTAKKAPCGQRAEAVRLARLIVEKDETFDKKIRVVV